MDFSSARSERITATISAVVAVIILAVGVTAHQSRHAADDRVVQLESDLRFQLNVGFRHDASERQARLTRLAEVLKTWQASPQGARDRELLADWLLEATIRSMPGSVEALPKMPLFGEVQEPVSAQVVPTHDIIVPPEASADELDSLDFEPVPVEADSPVVPEVAEPTVATESVFNTVAVSVEKPQRALPEVERSLITNVVTNVQVAAEPAAPVQINLNELAARIAGYHEGLDEVETTLLTLDSNDLTAIGEQVRQLEEMTRDFQFVRMYYSVLTDAERRSILEPRSMQATLAEIERRIGLSQQALDGDFLGEFDVNHQDRIAVLRAQLAKVASRIDW